MSPTCYSFLVIGYMNQRFYQNNRDIEFFMKGPSIIINFM